MWIIGGVGKLPFERNRQAEFDERTSDTCSRIASRLRVTVQKADDVMKAVSAGRFIEPPADSRL